MVLCKIGSGMNFSFNFRQLAPQFIPLVLLPHGKTRGVLSPDKDLLVAAAYPLAGMT